MRLIVIVELLFALNLASNAQTPAAKLWNELQEKRKALPSLQQEFELRQSYILGAETQASKRDITVDFAGPQWREKSSSGSGDFIRIFDGTDLYVMEGDSPEYIRTKHRPKDDSPVPGAYRSPATDWSKVVEVARQPCGFPENDRPCVTLDAPVKASARSSINGVSKNLGGTERVVLDIETGMIVLSRTLQTIQPARGGAYQSDTVYVLKRMSYGIQVDPALFKLPSGTLKEVKELSRWNAAKIKKQLAGKPAPELKVMDLEGKPLDLSAFKGKTVLLDFWTTWCPPCRADAPALDKLYKKYAADNLMIIGVSVSEDRPIVEKFLKEHPHQFPVVLTTENDMPRPYQIGVFPTYIVINPDGAVEAAVEGDPGFGDLRALLKKAGLETD